MPLTFQGAPDWLLKEYMERKHPVAQAAEGAQGLLNTYAALQNQQQLLQQKASENARQEKEFGLKQREQFYNYGDVGALPIDQQRQIGRPVQGPVTAEGIPPQGSPLIARFNEFLAKNPQGLKGSERTRNEALQQSEIEKNTAMAEMYRQGGKPGAPVLQPDPVTGELKWFVPPPRGGGLVPGGSGMPVSPTGQPQPMPTMASPGGAGIPVTAGATKAQQAVDTAFAKDYNEFVAQGGQADSAKMLFGLDDAVTKLVQTNATGRVMGLLGRGGRAFVNPKSGIIEDQVRDAVQRNLRVILGGQFAEREGENLVKTAFNPVLDEPQVAARLTALSTQMKLALQAKQEAAKYYEQNGTLRGFKGRTFTMADFSQAVNSTGGGSIPSQQGTGTAGGWGYIGRAQ